MKLFCSSLFIYFLKEKQEKTDELGGVFSEDTQTNARADRINIAREETSP